MTSTQPVCDHEWAGAVDAFYTEVYHVCNLCGAEKHKEPRQRHIVGMEEGSDGELRVFVDAYWRGRWFPLWDKDDQTEMRRAWASGSATLFTLVYSEDVVETDHLTA